MPKKYEYSLAEKQAIINNPWLTDREKKVAHLFFKQGWKIEDIAAEVDYHRRTVDNDLKRIREKWEQLKETYS